MMTLVINTLISAIVIALASWLGGSYPRFAGFIVALPLGTLLVLPMANAQHYDTGQMQQFGLSILIAVPVIMFFWYRLFLP